MTGTVSVWVITGTTILALATVERVFTCIACRKKVAYLPGLRSAFNPSSLFGALLPTSRFNPGLSWQWQWRNQVYKQCDSETISAIPYISGGPSIYTSSLEVAKQILSTKGQFVKPEETTLIVKLWGTKLFSENGPEWRRHRRILAPAFTNDTYALVWKETCSIYQDMCVSEGWKDAKVLDISSVNELTTKMALIVISRCGFGSSLAWDFNKGPKCKGDEMNFAEALVVSNSSILRLVTPRWMYCLPIKRLHKIDKACKVLAEFMQELIATGRLELQRGEASDRSDVFSLMIRASEAEGKLAMTNDELSGNTFLMLFAGHETTAHTLDAAMRFLALYEDIQQEVYEQIVETVPAGSLTTFEDAQKLYKVEACFIEAGRLFPAGFMLIRETTEDLTLTTYGTGGGVTGQIPLEAGTCVIVDMVGMQYNPRHYPEPEEFRPSRWYRAHENDLTMFSVGPRACIGRRFAITEATCFLTMLLRDWKLEIILRAGESRAQWRDRVMRGNMTMTLGVGTVPLRFVRR